MGQLEDTDMKWPHVHVLRFVSLKGCTGVFVGHGHRSSPFGCLGRTGLQPTAHNIGACGALGRAWMSICHCAPSPARCARLGLHAEVYHSFPQNQVFPPDILFPYSADGLFGFPSIKHLS